MENNGYFLIDGPSHATQVAEQYRNRHKMADNIHWMERQTAFWLLVGALQTPADTWEEISLSIDEDGISKCLIVLENEEDELDVFGDAEEDIHNEAFFFIDEIDFDAHKDFLMALSDPLTSDNLAARIQELFPPSIAAHMQAKLMQENTPSSPAVQPRPRM